MTLKAGYRVTQGHWNWYHSIAWLCWKPNDQRSQQHDRRTDRQTGSQLHLAELMCNKKENEMSIRKKRKRENNSGST